MKNKYIGEREHEYKLGGEASCVIILELCQEFRILSTKSQISLLKINYPYKLLSDNSVLLISGKLHKSGHKLPCSINNVNIFSSICSDLLAAVEPTVSACLMDEIRALMYLPRATGTRSSRHSENWVQKLKLDTNYLTQWT